MIQLLSEYDDFEATVQEKKSYLKEIDAQIVEVSNYWDRTISGALSNGGRRTDRGYFSYVIKILFFIFLSTNSLYSSSVFNYDRLQPWTHHWVVEILVFLENKKKFIKCA